MHFDQRNNCEFPGGADSETKKISDLEISYDERKTNQIDHAMHYINQYCANTLKSISFFDRPIFSTVNFANPFEMVENICICFAGLGVWLPYFAEWFPNLRQLQLVGVTDIRFPLLAHLTMAVDAPTFTMKSLDNLLDGCPKSQQPTLAVTN